MNRILNATLTAAAALALVAVTGLILGPNSQHAESQGRAVGADVAEVIRFDSYQVDFDSLDDAVNFVGAPLVIEGVVTDVGEPRWNGPGGQRMSLDQEWESGLPSYIWTPIGFAVTDVLRGTPPDKDILIRSLGGMLDGVRVDFGEMNAVPGVSAGDQLILFLDIPVDAGDGFVAWTPSFAYLVSKGIARSANGTHQVSVPQLKQAIGEGLATTSGDGSR